MTQRQTKFYVPMFLRKFDGMILGQELPLTLPEGVSHLLPVYTDRASLRRDYGDEVEIMEFRVRTGDE